MPRAAGRQGAGARASDALAQLRALRKGDGKRAHQFEVRECEAVYDVVAEEDYAKIVEKRRREAGDFLADDDGQGYTDIGEEDDFWKEAEDVEGAIGGKRSAHAKKRQSAGNDGGPRKKQMLEAPKQPNKMQQMFMRASVRVAGPQAKPTDQSSDALLEEILAGDGGSTGQVPTGRNPQALSSSHSRPARASLPARLLTDLSASILNEPSPCVRSRPSLEFNGITPAKVKCGSPGMMPEGLSDTPIVTPKPEGISTAADDHTTPTHDDRQMVDEIVEDTTVVPDTPAAQLAKTSPKTDPSTTKPTFETPSSVPPPNWQDAFGTSSPDEGVEAAKEEKPWVDDGTLPLDGEGNLPFYFLDAIEEPTRPGVVYLFGKVPTGRPKEFVSGCAIVNNIQRKLFVIPRGSKMVFNDDDGEISRLEAAAAIDPEQGRRLIAHLHGLAGALKEEIRDVLGRNGIKNFTMKPVKRSYAFEEPGIPHGGSYVMKVSYPVMGEKGKNQAHAQLQPGLSGNNFSKVFGTQQSFLESLLLKRRIEGPSWIGLKQPVRVDDGRKVSWCKLEVRIDNPKAVQPCLPTMTDTSTPPLRVAALKVKTHDDEVVIASLLFRSGVNADGAESMRNSKARIERFTGIAKLRKQPWPQGFEDFASHQRTSHHIMTRHSSERALLNWLLAWLQEKDPDVLIGHNIGAIDIPLMIQRMRVNKASRWSRIGRLQRDKYPELAGGGRVFGGGAGQGVVTAVAGRLLADTYVSAQELVHAVDFTLETLSHSHLNEDRLRPVVAELDKAYDSTEALSHHIFQAQKDAWLSMGLLFNLSVLPLSKELANITGSSWQKTLQGGRAQRTEMLLLHEFYHKKFIVPDKYKAKAAAGTNDKGGPSYAGGKVFEPVKGLYDKCVLLMDFNSLYPSIIQAFNICFTTASRPSDGSLAEVREDLDGLAVLPKLIERLVQRRQQVKACMKTERDAAKKAQMDIRQKALKLTANSAYGCLGFKNSRFYCKPMAELITQRGREILEETKARVLATIPGVQVIYGDTDSIMVSTSENKPTEVAKLGQTIKKKINTYFQQRGRQQLQLDVDGIYSRMLLLQKKKYAAKKLVIDEKSGRVMREELEMKGIDMVRRDWSRISKDICEFALSEILSGKDKEDVVNEIHERLRKVKQELSQPIPMDGRLESLEPFVIRKQLQKDPEEYADALSQPHVRVAKRLRSLGQNEGVMKGDTIPYVICTERQQEGTDGPPKSSLAERAYHPSEFNPSLVIDADYYLAHQIHPTVSRLCGPIEGTDEARLADCLGLDQSRFQGHSNGTGAAVSGAGDSLASFKGLDDDERFK
eukprot:evm.model.scf_244.12 EVM.evm.TU.scf_244.12   scf_244:99156-114216(+)